MALSCDKSHTSGERTKSATPKRVKLDVKTSIQDKVEFQLKLAVVRELKKSLWCKVVETDEDYSVWLIDPTITAEHVTAIQVELRRKSGIKKGKLLDHEKMVFRDENYPGGSGIPAEKLITDTAKAMVESQFRK